MNKIVEKLLYSFGINFSAYDVPAELDILKKNLPKKFLKRNVIDIGCGDGKVSLMIKEILQPKSFIGIDLSKSLIMSARKRGLNARNLDVEKQNISGDLGILWGVLHHFDNPVKTLQKINENFNSLIIRESINDKRMFELGHKFNREKLIGILVDSGIKNEHVAESDKNKSLIIFVR